MTSRGCAMRLGDGRRRAPPLTVQQRLLCCCRRGASRASSKKRRAVAIAACCAVLARYEPGSAHSEARSGLPPEHPAPRNSGGVVFSGALIGCRSSDP